MGLSKLRGPIGIEVGSRSLRAVQLSAPRAGWRLEAVAAIARQDDEAPIEEDEVRRLHSVLERQGFSGRDIVLAIPTDRLLTAVLELPPRSSGAPLDQISRAELAAAHQCDPQSIEIACWDLPEPARHMDGTCTMAVGCRQESALALLDAFEDSGFHVIALDVPSCALTRAVRPVRMPADGLAGILTIDWTSAHLVATIGDIVVYERTLADSGLRRVYDAIIDDLGLDQDITHFLLSEIGLEPERATDEGQRELVGTIASRIDDYLGPIATELRMSLSYVTKEYGRDQVDQLLLTGEVTIPGIAARVARETSLPTRTVLPTELVRSSNVKSPLSGSPSLITAVGLAQYSVGKER